MENPNKLVNSMAFMTDDLNESSDEIEIVPANNNSTRKLNPT